MSVYDHYCDDALSCDRPAETTPQDRYRAARVVAANAHDAHDAAELLGMLGLTAAEGLTTPDAEPATAEPSWEQTQGAA